MTKTEIIQEQSQAVVIGNELIQKSRYELTKTEQKAVLYLISKIKPLDDATTEYIFSIRRFCEVSNLNHNTGTYHSYLVDTLLDLQKKPLHIKLGNKKDIITSWFASAIVDGDKDEVRITFPHHLMPYLFELKEKYTSFFLENVLAMKSGYGIRLYEYLMSVKNMGRKHIMPLDIFRERVGCENKYSQFSELRISVIEPAIKDINTYSDINVSFNTYKEGRKVSHIEFIIEPLNIYEEMLKRSNRQKELLPKDDN